MLCHLSSRIFVLQLRAHHVRDIEMPQVRDALLRKKEKLVGMLKSMMARVPRAMMASTSTKFSELERQVKAKATNIEGVDAQRK